MIPEKAKRIKELTEILEHYNTLDTENIAAVTILMKSPCQTVYIWDYTSIQPMIRAFLEVKDLLSEELNQLLK